MKIDAIRKRIHKCFSEYDQNNKDPEILSEAISLLSSMDQYMTFINNMLEQKVDLKEAMNIAQSRNYESIHVTSNFVIHP